MFRSVGLVAARWRNSSAVSANELIAAAFSPLALRTLAIS
jgi:hypothetical protein